MIGQHEQTITQSIMRQSTQCVDDLSLRSSRIKSSTACQQTSACTRSDRLSVLQNKLEGSQTVRVKRRSDKMSTPQTKNCNRLRPNENLFRRSFETPVKGSTVLEEFVESSSDRKWDNRPRAFA